MARRFFSDDALQASKVLGIFSYLDHNFYVASVPTVRVKVHLRRLVEAGYKVRAGTDRRVGLADAHTGLCPQLDVRRRDVCGDGGRQVGVVRQTETAALKAAGLTGTGKSGTFERKVVGIFSQATFNEDDPCLAFVSQLYSKKPAATKESGKAQQTGMKAFMAKKGGAKGKGKRGGDSDDDEVSEVLGGSVSAVSGRG